MVCLDHTQPPELATRQSGSSNQWRRKRVQYCGMWGSSFDHHDIILVEKTTAAKGGIYLIMRT
jgi:hypothetical protein